MYPPPDSASLYDRDSNGLVDLEVAWSDSGGRVVPGTVRVTCAANCLPGATPDTNLAQGWRVVRLDSTGLVLEETLPLLLRDGTRILSVTVADTAGNRSPAATVVLTLPPGAYHQSISLAGGGTCQPERGVTLALSPDGKKGFAPYHKCVAVFDPEGVQPTHFIQNVPNLGWAADIAVDTATGLAYLGGGGTLVSGFTVLDTRTEQVVGGQWVGNGMASVAVDGDRVYAGEACTDGRIFVFDKRTLALIDSILVGASAYSGACPNSRAFQFSSDHKTGWAAVVDDGIIKFDAENFVLLEHVPLDSARLPFWLSPRSIILASDIWLYLAGIETLDEWSAPTLARTAHVQYPPTYKVLALAPDGRTLAVSSGTGDPGPFGDTLRYAPRLYNVPGMTVRFAFPMREGHLSDDLVWHPDGKRIYLMVEYQVDVYFVRPR